MFLPSLALLAQLGPGLGNLQYAPSEVFTPISVLHSPEGHGNVTMVKGYLMLIYSSDGGGGPNDGGIELWDVSNPRVPRMVVRYDDADTHGLRESHGYSLGWDGNRLLLAAQGVTGIELWDVSDPMRFTLLSYFQLPGIVAGDYSGDWWTFWQAPYLFVAGVDRGLYVVDTTDPTAPTLLAQVPTGQLGGVSPAQVFVLGNLAVIMEAQGGDVATLDVSNPAQPRLLAQAGGHSGYSHLFAGDGKLLSSGNVPPRAHVYQLSPAGDFNYLGGIGLYRSSGGYGSYQDGFFHSGFSTQYLKFQIDSLSQVGSGSSNLSSRDEDFATVLGNLVWVGDDHGVGSALVPHQAAPDTTPPRVEWMHPPSGATGVAPTSRVGLSFSDHVDAESLTDATIYLEDDRAQRVPVRRSMQQGLVNLAPEDPLDPGRSYRVVAVGVRDLAGNASPRFEGSFTVGSGAQQASPSAAITGVTTGGLGGPYGLGVFGTGQRLYRDRTYTYSAQHPSRFDGQPYFVTANADRSNSSASFLGFELLAPAEVVVLYDDRATGVPGWMSGFTATGETVDTSDTRRRVYSARFPVGPVRLGGNSAPGAAGAGSMYGVVVLPEPLPCEIDLSPVVSGTVSLSARAVPGASYAWRVEGQSYSGASPRVFLGPGRHPVSLTVTSGPLGASCGGVKIAHLPAAPVAARTASKLLWHQGHTVGVNADQGTVSRIDPAAMRVVWEAPAGARPETLALQGDELWVVDREGAAVHVLDAATGAPRRVLSLPRASQPSSIVFDPSGTPYLTLFATGEVVKLSPDGRIALRRKVAPTLRGLTWFDGRLYATRFVSPRDHGEVHVLEAASLDPAPAVILPFDTNADTEANGRGVPNYVAEVRISPDGRTGYVASKKDNVARGLYRDGTALTFESRVRTIVSLFDVATASAALSRRLDVNDRELVMTTLPSPLGDLLFVASHGANVVDVFDAAIGRRISQFTVGSAPEALALDEATGRLAVLNALSRTIGYYDAAELLAGRANAVQPLGAVTAIGRETLSPTVLLGKRVFHDASDLRMCRDKYISCASCHFEGDDDGRVWDFTQAGEGLRNTIPLVGRAGTGHGRVHWTANFDELQDFENDIRLGFDGRGFLSDADFAATRDPLGPPKAGRSMELDALAAYVATFTRFPPSPHRAEDGSNTAAARRGREVFVRAACARCHSGERFADGLRHDVGTITAGSGLGLGAPLAGVGFDTPTLRSIWASPPYLHDGSAETLGDAMARHGEVPALSAAERDELIAYLLELDGASSAPELPCAAGECVIMEEDAGVALADAGAMAPDAAEDATVVERDAAVGAPDAAVGGADAARAESDAGTLAPVEDGGCGCTSAGPRASGLWLLAIAWLVRRRRAGALSA